MKAAAAAEKRAAAAVAFFCVFFVGARDQCIPGPFDYDDNGQTPGGSDVGPPVGGCRSNADCGAGGACDANSGSCFGLPTQCQLGFAEACGPPGTDLNCTYDASQEEPLQLGVCRPVAQDAQPVGGPCSTVLTETSPCQLGAFCFPFDGDNGICVAGCDGPDSDCPADSICSLPVFLQNGGGNFRPVCMPICNLRTPDCGDARFVCSRPNGPISDCDEQRGACVAVGCDNDGCRPLCGEGAPPCPAGTFCTESTIDSCLFDGPDQPFSTCQPPGGEGDSCVLTEPDSCSASFACAPVQGFSGTGPSCIQQAGAPIPDGDPCTPPGGVNANVCERGSFCAIGDQGNFGQCQRFCDGNDDCTGDQQCVRANTGLRGGLPSEGIDNARVCASPCTTAQDCQNGLACDVDDDFCSSVGFCVQPEFGGACDPNGDCPQAGTTCDGSNKCVLVADACELEPCTPGDPTACGPGFTCSPFTDPGPSCVATTNSVADGSFCNESSIPEQCAPGSFCLGSTCQRLCQGSAECTAPGLSDCVRGNLTDPFAFGGEDPFLFFDLRVCAAPCSSDADCNGGFFCDRDVDDTCGGAGHCLLVEPQRVSCVADADCAPLPGTQCETFAGQNRCLPFADICSP